MSNFRWLIFALWVPVSIALGVLIGDVMSVFDKPWPDLSAGIVFPTLVLTGAWILAPYNKHIVVAGLYIAILSIAFYLSPSLYPAWHTNAYQSTYMPLVSAAGIGAAIVLLLWLLSRK